MLQSHQLSNKSTALFRAKTSTEVHGVRKINNPELAKAMVSHLRLKAKRIYYVLDLIDFVEKSIHDNCHGLISETTNEIFDELQSYGSRRLLTISYDLSMAGATFREHEHEKTKLQKYCNDLSMTLQTYLDSIEQKVDYLQRDDENLLSAI